MRIGLNATCLSDRPSGARQRFVGIYGALARLCPDTEFIVYEPRDCRMAASLGPMPNVTPRITPIPSGGSLSRLAAGVGYWSRQLRADRLDLFECFNMPMVEAPACPTLLTIHDARHIHDEVRWPRRPINRAIWRRALTRADHVITVSDTMREEISVFYPGLSISTIYNGIEAAPFSAAADAAKPGGYILAVGHIEPRKNYERLVAAIALLNRGDHAVDLVIVGRDGGSRAALDHAIADAGVGDRISIRSDVDDDTLAGLYANARLVVFPSLYEGFGIPVLEAMAARRPLVLSDLPVFREIAGDAAEFFAPTDPSSIARAMTLASEPARAAALVHAGKARVHDFAFTRLAEQLAALHASLLS